MYHRILVMKILSPCQCWNLQNTLKGSSLQRLDRDFWRDGHARAASIPKGLSRSHTKSYDLVCCSSRNCALNNTLSFSKSFLPPHRPDLELSFYFIVLFLLKKKTQNNIIKAPSYLAQGRHTEDIQFL